MGREYLPDDGQEIALSEALADYLERVNSGNAPELEVFSAEYPELGQELRQSLAILNIPRQAATVQPNLDEAWNKFRARVFTGESAKTASLGSYVQQAVESQDRDLKAAALSRETLEAMKTDATPAHDLKNYNINDYAAFARRYGVKDAAFPRLLKWLKKLANNLSAPMSSPSRGMAFARPLDRPTDLTEEELRQALTKNQPDDDEKTEGRTEDAKD